jgi:HlyD family secretion protein
LRIAFNQTLLPPIFTMKTESHSPASPPPRDQSHAGRWTRRLPWLGGAGLAALIVVGLWPKPLPVEAAAVARGPLAATVDEEGMTRVKNRYVVSAPIAGQLRRIDWKAGAEVVAGRTALAVLEPAGADLLDVRAQAQAEARVRGAEAAGAAAQAQKERASAAAQMYTTDFSRMQRLFEQKAISQQEFDAAQMQARTSGQDARAAEFALQVAEFELEQAKALQLRGTPAGGGGEPFVITSPVGGRVLRVLQESARVVPAGFPLVEVGDPGDLEARIEVLSRDAVAIQPGARVLLEKWGGPAPLTGRVRVVEPSAFTKISALGVEEQRVYVVVDFVDALDKRPTLGDAYRVEARIITWESPDVLKAPVGALFQRGGAWQTYVLDGSAARLRTVKIGHSNGLETEILEGLKAGDQVVVYPGDQIADGVRVKPMVVSGR